MMVRWDGDGYSNREWMLKQWLSQWPKTGLDTESLRVWYRSAMERHIEPDVEIIDFLTGLNHQEISWGIVTNGAASQRGKCRAAGLEQIAPFIIVSGKLVTRSRTRGYFATLLRPRVLRVLRRCYS